MSNPPPVRPWMRLASVSRPALSTAPAPAAPPPPPASVPAPVAPPPPPATVPAPIAPPPPPASVSAPVPPPEFSPAPRSPLVGPTFRTSAPTSPAMSPVISPPPPPVAPPVVVASTVPAAPPPSVISPTQNVEASSMAALPVISTFSVPPSPIPRGSVPSSPFIKPSKPTTTEIVNPSPKLIRTFAQSHSPPQPSPYKPQPQGPPPSPLTLPPSQLKYEAEPEPKIPPEVQQKTVLMQNGKGGSRPHENITGSAIAGSPHKSDVETKEKNAAQIKKVLDSNEKGTRVITIAGENRGSFMEIIHKAGKADNYFQKNGRRVGKNNEDTGKAYYSSDQNEEGNLNPRDKNQKTNGTTRSLPAKAFMNSNVQGVNNSILFNSSCSHHDPGVHLSLTRKPSDNGFRSKHHSVDRHS